MKLFLTTLLSTNHLSFIITQEQHKKMYKKRLKGNKLKIEHLTDKQEQGVELIHQEDKEVTEDHQVENPIEKA